MHANSTRAESKDLPVALPDFLELHPTLLTPLFGALAQARWTTNDKHAVTTK